MKKNALRLLLSVAMSLAVLSALMWSTDTNPKVLYRTLAGLPLWVYFAALAMHMATYCLRAFRFWLLIPQALRPRYRRVWVLSGAHNLASYLLPAKTGEASWVVYLRTFTGVPSSPGIASLVVSRLLDAAVLASALSLACMYLASFGGHGQLEEIAKYGAPLAIAGVTLAALAIRGDLLVHLLSKALRLAKLNHWARGEQLVQKISEIARAMRLAARGKTLGLAAMLTVPIWLCIFGFYAALARGMGIDDGLDLPLSFPEAVFGSSLAVLANLLPVNGAAGVGTQEAGWVFGFMLLGVEQSRALLVGLAVHFVQLFNVVSVGLFCHLAMKNMARVERLDFEGFLASINTQNEPANDAASPEISTEDQPVPPSL